MMKNDETKKIFELIKNSTSFLFLSIPQNQAYLIEELATSNKNEIICLAFLNTKEFAHRIINEQDAIKNKTNIRPDVGELIHLAKENSPNFLTRFQDAFPVFCEKITTIYPDIQNSELLFCAYLRLNFSTKDIAKFTFVSPKSIQMRKYRLRKKLNIPSEKDIYMWIKSIDKKN